MDTISICYQINPGMLLTLDFTHNYLYFHTLRHLVDLARFPSGGKTIRKNSKYFEMNTVYVH
jgi:hypothetical protein